MFSATSVLNDELNHVAPDTFYNCYMKYLVWFMARQLMQLNAFMPGVQHMRSSAFETKPCLSLAVWQALPIRSRLPHLIHLPYPTDPNVVPLMHLILELSSAHEKRDV